MMLICITIQLNYIIIRLSNKYNTRSMSSGQQISNKIGNLFKDLLKENPCIQFLKDMVKAKTDERQRLAYYALTAPQQSYLQQYGFAHHQSESFNYINQLLHQRTTDILQRITDNQITVRSTIPQPQPEPEPPNAELIAEVEEVLKNVDLPLSLFKRNDRYWSADNPKTIQVKDYIKQLHESDKKWKEDFKKKRQSIQNDQNQKYHQTIEKGNQEQQKLKEEFKIKMIKKIQYIKAQSQLRKKSIQESKEFMKKQGRPLFKKIQQEFLNKIQIPTLQEKKRKLSQLRQLRRSVDLTEIQQHKQKYQKIKNEHQQVKIFNQPVKVGFKSHFYKNIANEHVREQGQQTVQSLYQKKMQYGKIIKQNFKPAVSEDLAKQIEERVAQMKRKRARVNRKRQAKSEQDSDEGDQDQEEEKEPSVQQVEQPEPEDDEEGDSDDEDKPKPERDDQYDPDRQERYKLGLKYLEFARKHRKAKENNDNQSKITENITLQTISNKQINPNKQLNAQEPIDSMTNTKNSRIKYKNYLTQFTKTNKTIDFIDTSRIKQELTNDGKIKKHDRKEQLQQKIRKISEKTAQEEQLLKFQKVKKSEAINRKLDLDNAVIDTIKARLALMEN